METLEPGLEIRPIIDLDEAKLLAKKLYGISVLEITELNGYDDKNYKLIQDPNIQNSVIPNPSKHGYVLKILNSIDSRDVTIVEAQNEIMNFLNVRSITCPKPIRNIHSQLFSLETIGGKRHVVRLLEYVPGELLKDVPKSDHLFFLMGKYLANLDNILQEFNNSGLANRQFIWMLSKVPELDKFKYAIKDADKLELVEEVIEEFKSTIVPRMEKLEKGVIHGDINEMNVLVGRNADTSESECHITGIIDFGDVQHSYYVFELAIAMTYMMLQTGDPRTGGLVYAGYTVNRSLPDHEYRLLKTLVSARLAQSLTLGAYTIEQDPKNTYVTSTEKANGWELLRKIRKTKVNPDGDPTDWKTIARDFLLRS